jgi:hypothetical protein
MRRRAKLEGKPRRPKVERTSVAKWPQGAAIGVYDASAAAGGKSGTRRNADRISVAHKSRSKSSRRSRSNKKLSI